VNAADSVAAARTALGRAYLRTGDYESVERLIEHALAEARSERNRRAKADAISVQGMLLHYRAIELSPDDRAKIDWRPEQELFEQALALRRKLDDAEGIAESMFQLGLVAQVLRRDLEAGAPYVREARELLEKQPGADPFLRSEVHRHVGFDLLLRENRPDDAVRELERSLELRRSLSERGWTASGLVALAMAERAAGRHDTAAEHAREALELARAEGLRGRVAAAAANELRQASEAA
jgi:tetratricopeptide (TPR) repeat protein